MLSQPTLPRQRVHAQLATVLSCAVIGPDAELVRVEADIATGLERAYLVGLPDAAVREQANVRAAITNSGFYFSHRLDLTSTWPRLICARRGRPTICRLPWASLRLRARFKTRWKTP